MKVLYVISTLGGGGAESQLCSFVSCLKQRYPKIGFHVCALKGGGLLEKRLKDNKIDYTVIGGKSILHNIYSLRRMIKKENYDIVHTHMLYSDIAARYASHGTKCFVVATHHGLGKWKKGWILILDKLSKRRVNRFIMVSDQSYMIRLKREKYPVEKMTVVYNGINSSFVANEPKELTTKKTIKIGTIARMTDNKQINLMIDTMKDLGQYDFCFEIIGEGDNYSKLVNQTKQLELEEKVHFMGWQDDILSVIKDWDIFILTSINEDLPVSLLETMAQGIVPVASTVGGIKLLLDGGKNGMLCDSSDKNSFVKAIEFLINHPAEYRSMSLNCIETVKNQFIIDATVDKTVGIYHEIMREKE